jgi:hypothetical protein
VVNVRGLPYVIPDSVPPAGEESEEQNRAYRKKDERRGSGPGSGSGPWSAGRPRRDGGASADLRADLRVRVGGGDFCFEGGYDYRGGRDGGSSGGGRR